VTIRLEYPMPPPRSNLAAPLPPWVVRLGSAAILAHMAAVVVLVLAAPSGPWPTSFGSSMATEPQFAQGVSNVTTRHYLMPLKMTHNYHFPSNRPAPPGVFFEVRLKDEAGQLLKTVRVPDENANFWVRHRQTLLAQALADDQPVQPRAGEVVAAPGKKVQTMDIWDTGENNTLKLRSVPEHLIPRERPVFRPSGWSVVLARSYARYLCRVHGAASAEVIRHTREAVMPAVMFLEEPPPGTFDELVSSFGELPR
jgi:hypothetical protein